MLEANLDGRIMSEYYCEAVSIIIAFFCALLLRIRGGLVSILLSGSL